MHSRFILGFCCLLVGTPAITEAALPSTVSATLIESNVSAIELDIVPQTSANGLSSPSLNELLVSSVSSGTKPLTVALPRNAKKFIDTKAGVSLLYPMTPSYVIARQPLSELNLSAGYLFEVTVKDAAVATAVGMVSHGFVGDLGWDSLVYGVKSEFSTVKRGNALRLPSELVVKLTEKTEYLKVNGQTVEHNYIEYNGMKILGVYNASRKINDISIGIVTMYTDPSLVNGKFVDKKQLMTNAEALQFVATMLGKSTVNQKQAHKYFKISK